MRVLNKVNLISTVCYFLGVPLGICSYYTALILHFPSWSQRLIFFLHISPWLALSGSFYLLYIKRASSYIQRFLREEGSDREILSSAYQQAVDLPLKAGVMLPVFYLLGASMSALFGVVFSRFSASQALLILLGGFTSGLLMGAVVYLWTCKSLHPIFSQLYQRGLTNQDVKHRRGMRVSFRTKLLSFFLVLTVTPTIIINYVSYIEGQQSLPAGEQVVKSSPSTLLNIVTIGVLTAVVAVIIAVLASKAISESLAHVVEVSRRIAKGDLNQRVMVYTNSEEGDLALAFDQMQESLEEIAGQAQAIARGDFSLVLKAEGHLANAFKQMQVKLRQIADQAKVIAEGDLSHGIEARGDLADAFNKMVQSLSSLVSQIKEASDQINSAAREILASSEQLASGTEEQASFVEETSVAIEELSKTAGQIARESATVAATAEEVRRGVDIGRGALINAIQGVERIKEKSDLNSKKIFSLGERSQKIGEIIEIINGIATETKILSLNAAIEASRAGEAGKGFSVVASEVRRLAEKTVKSTAVIKNMIAEMQEAVNNLVMANEENTKEVENQNSLMETLDRSFERISEIVDNAVESAKQISIVTEQQTKSSQQVSASMKHISQVSRESAVETKQISAAAKELNSLADLLKEAVAKFKLDHQGSSPSE